MLETGSPMEWEWHISVKAYERRRKTGGAKLDTERDMQKGSKHWKTRIERVRTKLKNVG